MCFVYVMRNSEALSGSTVEISEELEKTFAAFDLRAQESMGDEATEDDKLELLPSSFECHDFVAQVGEVGISCHIMRMKDSLYIWVGEVKDGKMSDLTVAMISRYENLPVTTRIMGTNEDTSSGSLAKRLAKKCGRPVYVSFNLAVNNLTLPGIEKAIQTELNEHKRLLTF